jgi:2-polyprenyl-3-methyl-5-hydroxy-6-metoxy-1,4-benzoquinol methylase
MTKLPDSPNRTMSREDFDIPAIRRAADAIQATMQRLNAAGLTYSHWCGQLDDAHLRNGSTQANKGPDYKPLSWAYDDANIPWFTLWEYSWLYHWSGIWRKKKKRNILSLGGSSCALDATLAEAGHHVTVVEQRPYTVENTRKNAAARGWDMEVVQGNIADLLDLVPDVTFDMMFSTSVIFLAGVPAQQAVAEHLAQKFDPDGDRLALMTFDFANPNPSRYLDDPVDHFQWRRFAPLSPFTDNGERHHFFYPDPDKGFYTAGALVQRLER